VHSPSVGLHAAPTVLLRGGAARWGLPALVLLVLPLSWLAVEFTTYGGQVALWWPAAGIGVLACAATSAERRAVPAAAVGLLAALGNHLAGRDGDVAAVLAVANGLEAFVGGTVLALGVRGRPRLRTLEDLARLFLAAMAAALTVAVLVAAIAARAYGEDFLSLAPAVFTSHLAAVLVVTPLGMVVERKGHRASTTETWVQCLFLLGTVVAVFARDQHLPLAFLIFPAMVWGALRLAPRVVTWQLFLTAAGVTAASAAGWGVFAANPSDGGLTGMLVQALLVTLAGVALPLMVVRSHTVWAEDALESSDDMLDNIMSATTATAVLGTSLDGSIEFFNVGAVELTGWRIDEVVGRAGLAICHRPDGRRMLTITHGDSPDQELLEALVQPFQADRSQRSFSDDWDFQRRDGTVRTVSVRISKRYRDGEVVGYLGVAHDVTERRRQEEITTAALDAERQMVERLEQVDRAKNDFMATISHELRTPITSILGCTELLTSDETGTLPTMHRQILSRVERNGRRLMGLVEDVLTMSQIEAGDLRFKFREIDLRDVLARAAETEISVFGVAGVLLEQDVTDEPLLLTGDPDKLERAFAALLDNAAKYSDTGTQVRVRLHPDSQGRAVLTVADDGIGVSQADQAKMFDRFFRSAEAHERAIQGAGLGLPVAKSIVEGHRGTISCESEVGRGTAITVVLPLGET
jgi:PAS domain S-box-containing protein